MFYFDSNEQCEKSKSCKIMEVGVNTEQWPRPVTNLNSVHKRKPTYICLWLMIFLAYRNFFSLSITSIFIICTFFLYGCLFFKYFRNLNFSSYCLVLLFLFPFNSVCTSNIGLPTLLQIEFRIIHYQTVNLSVLHTTHNTQYFVLIDHNHE